MAYDDHQWALLPLLLSSMLVYILLVATVFMKFKYRMLVYIGMMLYFHQDAAKNTGKYSSINTLGKKLWKTTNIRTQKPSNCKPSMVSFLATSHTVRPSKLGSKNTATSAKQSPSRSQS